ALTFIGKDAVNGPTHLAIGVVWTVLAALIGLKGMGYVGKVASYLPIIPIVALVWLFIKTIGGVGDFNPQLVAKVSPIYGSDVLGVFNAVIPYVVGFFATAGAAGCDFGSGNKDGKSIVKAGLVGIFLTTFLTGLVALIAISGAQKGLVTDATKARATASEVSVKNPEAAQLVFAAKAAQANAALLAVDGKATKEAVKSASEAAEAAVGKVKASADASAIAAADSAEALITETNPTALLDALLGAGVAKVFWILLVVSAFPAACVSSLIAANSFKSTFPKVSPFVTCGIGTVGAVALVLSGAAGQAAAVFTVIGASFGPVCGALFADYILAGRKWAGPRAGFNPAGWLSWALGFAVGAAGLFPAVVKAAPFVAQIPVPPVSAFAVGLVVYFVASAIGLSSKKLELPQRIDVDAQ
ncbi:MAG: hypothetical protein LBV54_06725, partial [Puniceicoccales bacterium]|nr:hypothetical protein [Puniceicoccales bacterium]